jgi:hypothetical protein
MFHVFQVKRASSVLLVSLVIDAQIKMPYVLLEFASARGASTSKMDSAVSRVITYISTWTVQ